MMVMTTSTRRKLKPLPWFAVMTSLTLASILQSQDPSLMLGNRLVVEATSAFLRTGSYPCSTTAFLAGSRSTRSSNKLCRDDVRRVSFENSYTSRSIVGGEGTPFLRQQQMQQASDRESATEQAAFDRTQQDKAIAMTFETSSPADVGLTVDEKEQIIFETSTPLSTSKGTESATLSHGRTYPIGLIVNHNPIKQALMIAATSPDCSIIIEGRRGTCKSVLARSVHKIVPQKIKRVKDNPFNIDPGTINYSIIDTFLQTQLQQTNQSLSDLETEYIPTPFVTVPLGVMEDALIGNVDLEQSLEQGQTIFSPGLLAKAHRGILYIDEINLLDEDIASLLFQALADGYVIVEREGLSVRYPCKPLVIATYNPAEGEMRDHLIDRFAIQLSADEHDFTASERVEVVLNVESFSDVGIGASSSSRQPTENAQERLRQAQIEQEQICQAVCEARQRLGGSDQDRSNKGEGDSAVEMTSDQLLYLCETATRAGCEGQRAEIYAAKIAKASAALGGRQHVIAKDLELGVILAIAPRARFMINGGVSGTDESDSEAEQKEQTNTVDESQQQQPRPMPPMTPPVDWDNMFQDNKPEENQETEEDERMQDQNDQKDEETQKEDEEEPEELLIPLEFMFGIDSTPIDPRLMVFHKRTRKGKSGKRSRKYNIERGRFVRSIFPRGMNRGHLAVGATLRAAAPYQRSRRHRLRKDGDRRSVFVMKDDFRIKQMKKKTGSLVIFVVDASGSMALNRMSAAKGAAISLLNEAYKSRDKVALIAFHGEKADVVVPPTKSMAMATRRLEAMPCGSKTPLSDALALALRTGLNSIKVKQDAGRVILVLISDGRANVPLCVSNGESFDPIVDPKSKEGVPSREYLRDEAIAVARQIGANEDFDVLVIDTEDKFVSTGVAEEIARVARGNYYHLARTEMSRGISHAVQQAVKH